MSLLALATRQTVEFDPSNDHHREWVYRALQTRSWGSCPVKFRTHGLIDMENMIKSQLLAFYLSHEFG